MSMNVRAVPGSFGSIVTQFVTPPAIPETCLPGEGIARSRYTTLGSRVAVLNSIPDCDKSLLVLISALALVTTVRLHSVIKLIERSMKGKVIKMVRKMAAGPWWASACGVGTTVLAAYGESG